MSKQLPKVVRFGLVGVANTAIDVVLYVVGVMFGLPIFIANLISTSGGMLFSFFANRSFVFRATGVSRRKQAIAFIVVNVVGLWILQPVVIVAATAAFVELGLHAGSATVVVLAKLAAVAVGLVWNYVLYQRVVFRHAGDVVPEPAAEQATLGFVSRVRARYESVLWRGRARAPRLERFVAGLLALAAVAAIAGIFFNPYLPERAYPWYPLVLVVVAAVVLLPAWFEVAASVGGWLDRMSSGLRITAFAIATVVFFVGQVFLAHALARRPGFDAVVMFDASSTLASGGELSGWPNEYFALYPNNIFLLFVYTRWYGLWPNASEGERLFQGNLLGVVCMTTAAALTWLLIRRLLGTARAVAVSPAIVGLIWFSAWINTPYSDTIGMLFPVATIALWVWSRGARSAVSRTLYWLAIGLVVAIGTAIKPTTVLVWIAIIVVVGVDALRRRRVRKTLTLLAVPIVLSGIVVGGTAVAMPTLMDRAGLVGFDIRQNDQGAPLTHFLAMGATGVGGYNLEDVNTLLATPPDQRVRQELDLFKERVTEMGVSGYSIFLGQKLSYVLTDGTFHHFKEGKMADHPYVNTDPASTFVQRFFDIDGRWHLITVTGWQAIWVLILALIAAPLFRRFGYSPALPIAVVRVALIALLVFLLLFEARSRYLHMYVPLFIIVAAAGVPIVSRPRRRDRNL